MKHTTCIAVAFVGIASNAYASSMLQTALRQPRFAILNLPDSTYLQMEVDNLSGT